MKSSSFRTIKTLNVSNTDMANAKMSRLKIQSSLQLTDTLKGGHL